MPNSSPFAILRQPCNLTIDWATHRLEQAGFQAVRTFDLQTARMAHLDCSCPHHGTRQCNCQMVVVLVYQGSAPPSTLVIHGNDETSWLYLMSQLQQAIGIQQEKTIQELLSFEANKRS